VAGGTNEFAEDGDVGTIDADAARIDRKAKTLGEIEIHTGVVKFRKTVTLRGGDTIQSRRINRPGRTMTAPGPARQFVKLLPVAFLPSGHGDKGFRAIVDRVFPLHGNFALFVFTARTQHWMPNLPKRFSELTTVKMVQQSCCAVTSASATILQNQYPGQFSLPGVSNT
jgi:hypothetical protein